MTLDIAVTSRQMIKPSSPTPTHLRTYKLSLLDQYSPQIGVRLLLFYSAHGEIDTNMSARLKTSFAETLNDFYPLAGTVEDNKVVDCSDNGVEYLEAKIKARLSHFLECPLGDELNQLLPLRLGIWMSSDTQLQVQVSTFECGGLAIAVRISHKPADVATLCSFINTWASKTRGSMKIQTPMFGSAALFPPDQELKLPAFLPPSKGLDLRTVARRFVFHASAISALKGLSASKSYVKDPTRVEVVSALIWKCLMNTDPTRFRSRVIIAVNMRSRMVPPLSENFFGNLVTGAMLSSQSGVELHFLVEKMRESIREIDGNYLQHLRYDDGVSKFHYSLKQSTELFEKGELGLYTITSWCRFPFYEADFGWGKPERATTTNVAHRNVVLLMDTKYGDGIEASVALDEQAMILFETDRELLNFAKAI